MLKPSFPKSVCSAAAPNYVLEKSLANLTLDGNQAFDTAVEYRLQEVYGNELWAKLQRAGVSKSRLANADVLEVCAGTGFFTYHLLQRSQPKSLTINDISAQEIRAAQTLLDRLPPRPVSWVLGDMHEIDFERKFDLIIGNSFLHHFHDVPRVLGRFANLLRAGGTFISLHEPTPMATVVESAKLFAYPLAVYFPGIVNEIARSRYVGKPSYTDIWLFEPHNLKQVALSAGFSRVRLIPWHLLRPLVVQKADLHLNAHKPLLSAREEAVLGRAVAIDGILNRFLPSRFFGSICLVCEK